MKWNETILFIIILPYSRVSRCKWFYNNFSRTHPFWNLLIYDIFESSRTSFSMVQYAKINIVLCHALLPGASSIMFIEKECLRFRCDPTAEEEKVEDYLFVSFFLSPFRRFLGTFLSEYLKSEWINESINKSINLPMLYLYLYPDNNCIVLLSRYIFYWMTYFIQ